MAVNDEARTVAGAPVLGRVSIVIPTRGPSWPLDMTLSSLSVALPLRADVEVIVVHDGVPRDLSETTTGLGHPTTVLTTGAPSGPANARNIGFAASTGATVVFLDDDVIVPPGWFEGLHEALQSHPDAGLIGARILPAEPSTLVSDAFGTSVIRHERIGGRWFLATACLAVRRDAFDMLGGFDERFDDASGEDWDLCRRAHGLGIGVTASDRFAIHHRNPNRLRQILSRSRRYARSASIRFSEPRPVPAGDPVDELANGLQRARTPLGIAVRLGLAAPQQLRRRFRTIRRAGLPLGRSWLVFLVHLPWLASYAAFSAVYAARAEYRPIRRPPSRPSAPATARVSASSAGLLPDTGSRPDGSAT